MIETGQIGGGPRSRSRREAELRLDARWPDAARAAVGLWLLVLAIYLPDIVRRHRGTSLAGAMLDASTILVSLAIALGGFGLFRRTLARPPAARIAIAAVAIFAAAGAQAGYGLLLAQWLVRHPAAAWPTMAGDLARGYLGLLNDAIVFAINLGLYQLAFSRRRGRRQERRLAAMRVGRRQAELDALRFKLNPHFLFNTLNGISAMIVTKRLTEADEMVDRLSSFLRASFKGDGADEVTIEHELGLIEHYARIEEFRFGDRLAFTLDCAGEACEHRVPPLLVQQLVEHAVEAASRADVPTRIAVTAGIEGERLCVTIAHPHLEMPEQHLAAARVRVAGLAGAEVVREAGLTRLCLPAARIGEGDAP